MRPGRSTGRAHKLSGILLLVCGAVLAGAVGDPEASLVAFVGVVGGALAMIAGLLLQFRGRQHAARAAATGPSSPLSDDTPDVLYLRSFDSDPSSVGRRLQSGLTTDEEQLAAVLKPFGALIAIGEPGEPLPLPGAARVYASNAEWQGVVLARMRAAALVVIRAGAGPGLRWELAQAFRHLRPERLLILVLHTPAADYSALVRMARTDCGITLPDIGRASLLSAAVDHRDGPSTLRPGFIRFAPGWVAEFLPLPQTVVRLGYNDLVGPLNRALRPVFGAHRVSWREIGRRSR